MDKLARAQEPASSKRAVAKRIPLARRATGIAAALWLILAAALAFARPTPAAAPPAIPTLDRPSIHFAGSRGYPPFEWQTDDGEAKGFLIDLEDTLAAQAGITARHQQMEWRLAPYALDHGEVDAVPMFISEERRKRFRFTDPFYYVTHAIYGRRNGPTAGDIEDLTGHSVAVVGNGYAAEQLRGFEQPVQRLELEDIATALRAVDSGRADFAVLATHTTRRLITDMDLPIDQVSPPIWPRAYAFAVDKDETELLRWLQHQLRVSQANGGYYRVYEDWKKELEWHRPGLAELIGKYSWLVAPVLTVLLLVSLWSWLLHRRVESRTADLTQALEHRREAEQRLAHAALHDMQTGLPNRAHFLEELTRLAARHPARELTVAALRLNGIEEVVLTFGHAVGMELLRAFGSRLYSYGFEAIGYLGSGEFAVASHRPLSPEHLIRVITVPVQLEEMEIDPRVSIGVVHDQDADSSDELLRKVRTAVAAATENRRTWQNYEPDIEPNPRDLLLLRDYWHRGTRDMETYLQPQIDPVSNRVVGAEALVRWRHPEHGLLPPGMFIPVLEKSGIVYRVTQWMVDQAARLAHQYRQEGRPCPISVNIAASDILEHDVVGMVRATLAQHQLPASDLRLEMTETGLITEPARVRGALQRLRETGVECSVDDFGTGYSSLSYLSDFPVSAIKIDRRFVAGITASSRLRSIVRTAVELAHELGLHVVAEGAEDVETVATLRAMGCDAVQGFVYAPPMPAGEFHDYLSQHAAAP